MNISLDLTKKILYVYNIVMLLIYLCSICLIAAAMLIGFADSASFDSGSEFTFFLVVMGTVLFLILAFLIFFTVALFRVNVQSKFNYYMQIVGLILGMTSILTMVPAIFGLIGLISEEARDYYLKS